jgi:DNA-binding LacI/PurR family transcriptional regulator
MFAKTTLDEVGRQAGVSASTVSRVLSGARGVNENTRTRVLSAIRQLSYHASIAHNQRGQSRLIGFLMPVEAETWGVRTNFTEQALRAVSDIATKMNYAAMVGSYQPDLGSKAEDEMIRHGEFAGVLLFRTKDETRDTEPFRNLGIPFLVVNRLLPETGFNYIGPDHKKVGLMAAGHLLERGYKRIGLLLGKTYYSSHRLYLDGFREAHEVAGVAMDPNRIREVDLNVEGGYAGTKGLLEEVSGVDALVITGDRASLGSLKALAELKIAVPKDLGIVAMDGTPETAFANPGLTAVEIPWYDMLAMGTRLLIDLIEHRPPVEQIGVSYATRLVVRESTRSTL